MKVRALDRGFYGQYRKAGDEFNLEQDKDFAPAWMEDAATKHDAPKEREDDRVVVSQGKPVVLPRKDDLGPEPGEIPKPRALVTRDPGPGATTAQMHGLEPGPTPQREMPKPLPKGDVSRDEAERRSAERIKTSKENFADRERIGDRAEAERLSRARIHAAAEKAKAAKDAKAKK